MKNLEILTGDCRETLKTLEPGSIACCVTSPPYFGLRDYGNDKQIGLEQTPDEFVQQLVSVFREVKRVLKDDGTLWVNLGDSYAGSGKGRNSDGSHREGGKQGTSRGTIEGRLTKNSCDDLKPKDLIGIPWKVAFALQADGWYLRQDIIWSKPNPMPESVRDRCTKSHEYIFLLSKSKKYFYDHEAIKENSICGANGSEFHTGKTGIHQLGRAQKVRPSKDKGSFSGKTEAMASTGQNAFRAVTEKRNKRSVWNVATKPYGEAHFATYPPELIESCIFAGCPIGGTVLDPFGGSGTTAGVALAHDRKAILCELNPDYTELIEGRIADIERYYVKRGRDQMDFFDDLMDDWTFKPSEPCVLCEGSGVQPQDVDTSEIYG